MAKQQSSEELNPVQRPISDYKYNTSNISNKCTIYICDFDTDSGNCKNHNIRNGNNFGNSASNSKYYNMASNSYHNTNYTFNND